MVSEIVAAAFTRRLQFLHWRWEHKTLHDPCLSRMILVNPVDENNIRRRPKSNSLFHHHRSRISYLGNSSLDVHPAADSSAGNCPKTLVNPHTLKLLKACAAGTWSCWLFVGLCTCAWTSLLRTRLPKSVEEVGEIWSDIPSSSSEGHKNQMKLGMSSARFKQAQEPVFEICSS